MRRGLTILSAALLAAIALGASTAPVLAARPAKKPAATFEVCGHGCRYRTIGKAVDAAGAYAYRHPRKVTVRIRPGRYAEGVVLDGSEPRRRFDGMTIEGTRPDRRRTILEGAGGRLATTTAGIEAIGVSGLVLRDMWARNFPTAGFLVADGDRTGARCTDYTMENLLASGNGAFGLAARRCIGGKMLDSAAYRQGSAGFSIAETPCSGGWSPYSGAPCQARPRWTLLQGDASYENALGFGGPNSKYVRVIEGAFYDDGAGIVLASVAGVGYEPAAWNMIERNLVFWDNYDYFLAASAFEPTLETLGETNGRVLRYPIGVGIALYGGDGDIVRGNSVFGNYKWGIASFSAPGASTTVEEGGFGKNVDNEIVENSMGRAGADPNGEYDFFTDATGGGNCWGANGPGTSFALGNGKSSPGAIYPVCPQTKVDYGAVRGLNLEAGLQVPTSESHSWKTSLGYLGTSPPQDQQCSWVRRVQTHPRFQTFESSEVTPRAGELSC
jgi:hypothetical protein